MTEQQEFFRGGKVKDLEIKKQCAKRKLDGSIKSTMEALFNPRWRNKIKITEKYIYDGLKENTHSLFFA